MKIGSLFGNNMPDHTKDFQKGLEMAKGYIPKCYKADEVTALLKKYHHVLSTPTVLGIEVEVENMKKEAVIPNFWIQEGDGSLRNGGREFKTWPLSPEHTYIALHMLWNVFNKFSKENAPDFSWRTSEHVHISVQNLEVEEMRVFVALILLFEPYLFAIAGHSREQSNFCVPLNRSSLFNLLRKFIHAEQSVKDVHNTWNSGSGEHSHGAYKYAAVNFARLHDLGTVEFRHMGGTEDVSLLYFWVSVLLNLYRAALSISKAEVFDRIKKIDNHLDYAKFWGDVFPKTVSPTKEAFLDLYNQTFPRIKELIIKPQKFPVVKESAIMEYAQYQLKKNGGKVKEPPTKK